MRQLDLWSLIVNAGICSSSLRCTTMIHQGRIQAVIFSTHSMKHAGHSIILCVDFVCSILNVSDTCKWATGPLAMLSWAVFRLSSPWDCKVGPQAKSRWHLLLVATTYHHDIVPGIALYMLLGSPCLPPTRTYHSYSPVLYRSRRVVYSSMTATPCMPCTGSFLQLPGQTNVVLVSSAEHLLSSRYSAAIKCLCRP